MTDDEAKTPEDGPAPLRNWPERYQSRTGRLREADTRSARKRLRQAETTARMEHAAQTEQRKRAEQRRVEAARAKRELEAQERREANERLLAEEQAADRARRAELAAKEVEERRRADRERAEREAAEQTKAVAQRAEAEATEAERQRVQADTSRRLYEAEQQLLTIKWVAGIIAVVVALIVWLKVISPAIYGECGEYGYKDPDTSQCVGPDIDYDPPGPVGP